MIEFEKKIAPYIEKNKKNSKLNKSQTQEVVSILRQALDDQNFNIDNIINVLLELHYSVTTEFFKEAFNTLGESRKLCIIDKFVRAEKIIKNTNNFGINRFLFIINELLQTKENEEYIHMLLKACAKKAYGDDGGLKSGKLLAEVCFKHTQDKIYSLDFSKWEEEDLRKLLAWLDKAVAHTSDATIIDAHNKFVEKYKLPINKKVTVVTFPKTEDGSDKPHQCLSKPKIEPQEKIFSLIKELHDEAFKMLEERLKIKGELDEVKDKLAKVTDEKQNIALKLSDAQVKIEQLQEVIKIKEEELLDAKRAIADLDERLKKSFNSDNIRYNQELSSLKNDLAKRLKPDYQDFIKLRAKEPTAEYYAAILDVVENVFHTLRKKGIDLNQENEV